MQKPTGVHLAFTVTKPSFEIENGVIEYVYLPAPDNSSEKHVCKRCIHRGGCNAKTIIARDLPGNDERRVLVTSCTIFSDGQKSK